MGLRYLMYELIRPMVDGFQVLGNMKKNLQSLLLITVVKNIKDLGYDVKVSSF